MKVHDRTIAMQAIPHYLGVSQQSLYKWAKSGELPFPVVKVGQRIIVPRDAFEQATGITTDIEMERQLMSKDKEAA